MNTRIITFSLVLVSLMGLILTMSVSPATAAASARDPVVHMVSAGGPDLCNAFGKHPGCDGNFSLVGFVYADGSMSGEYTDRFANGDGIHAVIDCVSVVGSEAWVSGVITRGSYTDPDTGQVYDFTGLPFATRFRDNGTSARDTVDQLSFSWFGGDNASSCTDHIQYPLFDEPQGQVVVK